MTERGHDAAFEVDKEGRVVRDPVETIGAVPGDSPPDISGGAGEGTGWGAWRAEHEAEARKTRKSAKSKGDDDERERGRAE